MTRPVLMVFLLALVSIAGIAGMLLADGVWDWLFLVLAALPSLLAAVAIVQRNRLALRDRRRERVAMAGK